MNKLRQVIRLIRINFILIKHGLDKIVLSIPVFAPLEFLAYLNPWNWAPSQARTRGERITAALIELGPIFVKFGQALSTRSDLLPEDIALELTKLQDNVPPFSGAVAQAIIEQVYGQPITTLFANFDPIPLASASIAQVHAVLLPTGQEAVIKIVRPGIAKNIREDVDLLYTLAKLAERFWSYGVQLQLVEVVKEFEQVIFNELDLQREAANASQLRRNFANSDLLYVPEIYWDYVREQTMVMERIYGIPIGDMASLKVHQIDFKKLAENSVTIFFMQVFRDCFFHADMHPGNLFINAQDPSNPKYIAVDFGIMGTLNAKDQRYLAENFLAFFKRDYRRVAELHLESGWIPADTRLDEFESTIRAVCEPVFEQPLKKISLGRMLMKLLQEGRRFNMQIQPQLMLLQKTLITIEGLGRTLYPDLDLWSTAKPYLEQWTKKQFGVQAALQKTQENLPYWLEKLPTVPALFYDALQAIKSTKNFNEQLLQQQQTALKKQKQGKTYLQGFGGALLLVALGILIANHSLFPQNQLFFWQLLGLLSIGIFALLLATFLNEK